jgi:DNA-binding CsgD family transcriptional regulator
VGLGVAVVSALIGVALLAAPVLSPTPVLLAWQSRAPWVIGWGLVVYVLTALMVTQPVPAPEPGPAPRPPELLPSPPYPDGLTKTEVEVLCLLAAGLANKQIAAARNRSLGATERQVADIYNKINRRNRAEATRYAIERGLVKLDPGSGASPLRQPVAPSTPT